MLRSTKEIIYDFPSHSLHRTSKFWKSQASTVMERKEGEDMEGEDNCKAHIFLLN